MAGDLDARRAPVCKTSLTKYWQESNDMNEQHCNACCNNLKNSEKCLSGKLATSSLEVIGSIAMNILVKQGGSDNSECYDNFMKEFTDYWGPREPDQIWLCAAYPQVLTNESSVAKLVDRCTWDLGRLHSALT